MKKLILVALLSLAAGQVFADLSAPRLIELSRAQGQCHILSAQITEGGSLVIDYAVGSRPANMLIMRSDRGLITENDTIEYELGLLNGTTYIIELDGTVDTAIAGSIEPESILEVTKTAGYSTVSCK